MQINDIGYNHRHDADFNIDRPYGSGDYMLLILKTPARFIFEDYEQNTTPNSVILYRKGTPQRYCALGAQFVNDWIHFTIDDNEMVFFEALDIPFDKVINVEDINGLSMLVNNMSYEHYSINTYKTDSVELYMKLLFIKLSELIHGRRNQKPSSDYDNFAIIRSQIYNKPNEDWNIAMLAHRLAMSKSHFQHLYKEIFGVSAMNDVINSRIEHAKYLLSSTDLQINQISLLCGYKCHVHFMRQFKSRMDMTASEYRDKMQNR